MTTQKIELAHDKANPQGLVAEFGRSGDAGIYDEVRVSVMRPDGSCVGDVLVGLTAEGELRVLVTTGNDGDQDHGVAVYPQRDLSAAVEIDSSMPVTVSPPKVIINLDGGIVHGVMSDKPVDVLVLDHDVEGVDEDDCMLVPDPYGLESAPTVVYKTNPYASDVNKATVECIYAAVGADVSVARQEEANEPAPCKVIIWQSYSGDLRVFSPVPLSVLLVDADTRYAGSSEVIVLPNPAEPSEVVEAWWTEEPFAADVAPDAVESVFTAAALGNEAERVLGAYSFGYTVNSATWDAYTGPGLERTATVYVSDAEGGFATLRFTVRLDADGQLIEAYALDEKGQFVGGMPAEKEAVTA